MIAEPFAVGKSWVHNIDPRARVIFATVYSLVVAVSTAFPVLLTALVFSAFMVGFAKLNLGEVGRRLAVVLGFLLLIWVIIPITFEGETLFHFGWLTVSRPGVLLAARITMKGIAILLIFMSLVATMTVVTLGHTLNCLHVPGKLVQLLLMTYRYIFVIEDEYKRLRTAIKIRGFRSGTNVHSYKTFAYLIGMLFVRASVRAERVHQAMLCRGFKGKFYTLDEFPSSGHNRFFSMIMMITIISLIMLEWNWI